MLQELRWLFIPKRLTYKPFYKALNNMTPTYLTNLLMPMSAVHNHSLRSSSNGLLSIPRSRTGLNDGPFLYTASRLWNSLPPFLNKTLTDRIQNIPETVTLKSWFFFFFFFFFFISIISNCVTFIRSKSRWYSRTICAMFSADVNDRLQKLKTGACFDIYVLWSKINHFKSFSRKLFNFPSLFDWTNAVLEISKAHSTA